MRRRPQVLCQLLYIRKLVQVLPGYGGIDLELNGSLLEEIDASQRPGKGSGNLAKFVMAFGRGPIQADAHSLNGSLAHLFGGFRINEESVGGQNHTQTYLGPIGGNLENIRPQQRFTSRENHDGAGERDHLI